MAKSIGDLLKSFLKISWHFKVIIPRLRNSTMLGTSLTS